MKAELLKYFLAAFMIGSMCGCESVNLSVQQQAELDESMSRAGLHAKFMAAGTSGITLNDPVQSELSGPSLGQIIEVVRSFRDQNQIGSIRSVGIQGPSSYVSVDLPPSASPASSTKPPGVQDSHAAGDGSTSNQRSQIIDAMSSGNAETVCTLAQKYPELYDAKTKDGRTPLQFAAGHGPKDLVQLLLDRGADVNAKASSGGMPLHYAAELGNKEIAELLLARGADVNAKNDIGATPLYQAVDHGQKELVALLLANGADVNTKADSGNTPLHWAAHDGRKDIVELLLAKNANVGATNNVGFTPLHAAAWSGDNGIVELLLAKGANVNAKTNEGFTPLKVAIQRHNESVAILLHAHGAGQ